MRKTKISSKQDETVRKNESRNTTRQRIPFINRFLNFRRKGTPLPQAGDAGGDGNLYVPEDNEKRPDRNLITNGAIYSRLNSYIPSRNQPIPRLRATPGSPRYEPDDHNFPDSDDEDLSKYYPQQSTTDNTISPLERRPPPSPVEPITSQHNILSQVKPMTDSRRMSVTDNSSMSPSSRAYLRTSEVDRENPPPFSPPNLQKIFSEGFMTRSGTRRTLPQQPLLLPPLTASTPPPSPPPPPPPSPPSPPPEIFQPMTSQEQLTSPIRENFFPPPLIVIPELEKLYRRSDESIKSNRYSSLIEPKVTNKRRKPLPPPKLFLSKSLSKPLLPRSVSKPLLPKSLSKPSLRLRSSLKSEIQSEDDDSMGSPPQKPNKCVQWLPSVEIKSFYKSPCPLETLRSNSSQIQEDERGEACVEEVLRNSDLEEMRGIERSCPDERRGLYCPEEIKQFYWYTEDEGEDMKEMTEAKVKVKVNEFQDKRTPMVRKSIRTRYNEISPRYTECPQFWVKPKYPMRQKYTRLDGYQSSLKNQWPPDSLLEPKPDFLLQNALEVLRKPRRIPIPKYIDHCVGKANNWCDSGLARNYVYKPDYGRVPDYLTNSYPKTVVSDYELNCILSMCRV